MKRRLLILLLLVLLAVAGIGAGVYIWSILTPRSQTNSAPAQVRVAGTSTVPPDTYIYYALKDAKGFVLARAPRGSDGRPVGKLQSLTLLGNNFGMMESDRISTIELSPDGRYVEIDGMRDHGDAVWIYDALNRTIRLVPANVTGNFLHWLPGGNGHTFLYRPMLPLGPMAPMGNDGWNPGLWTIDAATGKYKNIDIGVPSAYLIDAASSPDGGRIIYSTTAGLSMGSDTWLMNSDGSGRTHLFSSAGGAQSIVGLFAWSPDSKQIAYERLSDSPTPFLAAGLWIMNSQGGQQRRLADADGGHGFTLTWSPDSRKIAFIARTNLADRRANVQVQSLQSAIGIVSVDSGSTWLVASSAQTGKPLNTHPSWTADSAAILFTASDPVNTVIGGTPRYWSASVTGPQIRPQVVPVSSAISNVVAVG